MGVGHRRVLSLLAGRKVSMNMVESIIGSLRVVRLGLGMELELGLGMVLVLELELGREQVGVRSLVRVARRKYVDDHDEMWGGMVEGVVEGGYGGSV